MRLPENHPLRYALNNEIHARPPEEFTPPAQISYLALIYPLGTENAFSDLEKLCEMAGIHPPRPETSHFRTEMGQILLKWERHTEFVTYTFSRHAAFDSPFEKPVIAQIPKDWLAEVRGQILVAIHLAIRDHRLFIPDLKDVAEEFSGNYLVGAKVGGGKAIALTDFRIHENGFSRMLLMDIQLGKRQCGRTVRRLVEIETYRMMALIALPVAREASIMLSSSEQDLAAITSSLASVGPEQEPELLYKLSRLAASVENQVATTSFRFGAARAYYALVKRRIAELREERLVGVQTVEEFMERRLAPAMNTCESIAQRLFDLSERIARASDLLRTRVDIEREQQNLALLASMDRRAKLQLRLQQTVEGLSVAAITYYVVGLIGYLTKAVTSLGIALNPEMLTGASIPFVALIVWWSVRHLRKKITSHPT